MFGKLGRLIARRNAWLLALGAALIIAGATYGTGVFGQLGGQGFADPESESYKAAETINQQFGSQFSTLLVLFSSNDGLRVEDTAYQQEVERALALAAEHPEVESITSFYTTGATSLRSNDGTRTYAVIKVKEGEAGGENTIAELRETIHSERLTVNTGGAAAIDQDISEQVEKDLARAETISFALLAVLLIVVFRSVVAAALPLILGAIGVLGAFLIVRLLTNVMDISQYAINVIILLGLGLAIDYSLFVVSRFREQLRAGQTPIAALERTMETAGRTVFFSGITVILSLLGLLIFPINFLQSMGAGGAAAVAVAMLAALVVLPAALVRLGHRVNWLSFGRVRRDYQSQRGQLDKKETERRSVWYRIAGWATRRPILALLVIIVPLALVSQLLLQAKFASPDYRSLPAGSSSRAVVESLRNDFPSSDNGSPIQVLLQLPSDTPQVETANLIDGFIRNQVEPLPGVTTTEITGTRNGYTLVEVAYNSNYDEPLARELVTQIRELPTGDERLRAQVGGPTAELVDLLDTLSRYAPYAAALVALALTVLLFLMLGSVVVPLQAIFVNLLALSATFGILVWIFQFGHLEKLLGFTSVGSIDATQPVLIFAIAFGLSMDYAVFLLSRVKEEYDHSGEVVESVKEGVQKTGTIITSAAILLLVVVGAFATSSIPLIKQVGLGLGLAIFIDAFIVRMLLVPALMSLCGRANWWAPAWLRRLSQRSGLSE